MKLPLKQLLLALGLAATVYALVLLVADGSSLAKLQQRLLSGTGLLCAALCILSYVLRGLRWRLWMRHYERPLGLLQGLRLYLAGYTFTPTPGNIGEAARGLLLAHQPLSAIQSLAIFGAERLADLACLVLLSLPGVVWLLWHITAPAWLPALGLSMSVALFFLATGLYKYGPRILARFDWIAQAWQALRQRPCVWLSLTLSAWALQGVVVWLLCREQQVGIGLVQATGFYALAMIGGAASLLPAGLGGTEALLTGLLLAAGASMADALGITVLVRLFTLWLAVLVGAAALFYSAAITKDIRFT